MSMRPRFAAEPRSRKKKTFRNKLKQSLFEEKQILCDVAPGAMSHALRGEVGESENQRLENSIRDRLGGTKKKKKTGGKVEIIER